MDAPLLAASSRLLCRAAAAIPADIHREGAQWIRRQFWSRSVLETLRLSRSEAVAGAELYEGEDIETFATGWHFHEGWQLVAMNKGERHYQLRGGSILAGPGQLIVLPPRLVHKARCLGGRGSSFQIATMPDIGLEIGAPSAAIAVSSPRLVDAFVSVFRMLAFASDAASKAMILPRLREILSESMAASDAGPSALPPIVLQMESYLLRTLDKVPSLDSLSSLAGLSRYHFVHTFSRYVGLSPLAFHARARLMRARLLLAQGWSLADTSASLNFADQSHFGRHFKRVYGMTPGDYQQGVASGVGITPSGPDSGPDSGSGSGSGLARAPRCLGGK
jgi:AraC-like DNA-binding protein